MIFFQKKNNTKTFIILKSRKLRKHNNCGAVFIYESIIINIQLSLAWEKKK